MFKLAKTGNIHHIAASLDVSAMELAFNVSELHFNALFGDTPLAYLSPRVTYVTGVTFVTYVTLRDVTKDRQVGYP